MPYWTTSRSCCRGPAAGPRSGGPFGGLVEWFRFRGTRPTLTAEGELLRNSRQVLFSAQWRAALPDTVPESEFLRMGSDLAPPASAHAEDPGVVTVTNMRTP
jgi:hypothetical protein